MAIPVKLPVFEGPLDLLLHLIEKNKIDIYDIPIAEITDQYLEYVHHMDREDMDVTSEFLVMAATLLEIKSRMLLPREKNGEEDGEEQDPREELVERLLEYKMYKYLSEELAVRRAQAGGRFFRARNLPDEVRAYQPPIDYGELLRGTDIRGLQKVFGEVLRRKRSRRDPIRSGFGKIQREEVSIDAKSLYIRAYLKAHPRTEFRALLESQESREEVIVTFLILLELMKTQKVRIIQEAIGGNILVELSETASSDAAEAGETEADGSASDPEAGDAPSDAAEAGETEADGSAADPEAGNALLDTAEARETEADESAADPGPGDVPLDATEAEKTEAAASASDSEAEITSADDTVSENSGAEVSVLADGGQGFQSESVRVRTAVPELALCAARPLERISVPDNSKPEDSRVFPQLIQDFPGGRFEERTETEDSDRFEEGTETEDLDYFEEKAEAEKWDRQEEASAPGEDLSEDCAGEADPCAESRKPPLFSEAKGRFFCDPVWEQDRLSRLWGRRRKKYPADIFFSYGHNSR